MKVITFIYSKLSDGAIAHDTVDAIFDESALAEGLVTVVPPSCPQAWNQSVTGPIPILRCLCNLQTDQE